MDLTHPDVESITRCCHFPNLLSGWSFVKSCWKLVYPCHWKKKKPLNISKDIFPHKLQAQHTKSNTRNKNYTTQHVRENFNPRLKEARERRQSMADSSCNAAINACVKVAEWSRALHLFAVRVKSCAFFNVGFLKSTDLGEKRWFWKLGEFGCENMFDVFFVFKKET